MVGDRRFHGVERESVTANHDVTAGVTDVVTESVTVTSAVTLVTVGVTEVVTDTVTRVTPVGSKVAENASDICHAVRLRLSQSLIATRAEVRLRSRT